MDQVLRTGEKQEMRFFHKIRIEHNKLIFFLILMISVDYEKYNYFSVCTGNDSFIFIITNQKFYWTPGSTDLL